MARHLLSLRFSGVTFASISIRATSAYMVVHAEGLTGIELHYTARLTVQPVRGFENGGHHFSAAESSLPAVSEPPASVPSSPHYHYFRANAHVAAD